LNLTWFSGMRILVMLLLDTLPMLGNVLLLCFFVFFIFGIIGVQVETFTIVNCFKKLDHFYVEKWTFFIFKMVKFLRADVILSVKLFLAMGRTSAAKMLHSKFKSWLHYQQSTLSVSFTICLQVLRIFFATHL